jgi:hypothetical protein
MIKNVTSSGPPHSVGLLSPALSHSFKSPAIAEHIAGYSCLRLIKLRAIARYIPLYLYLASAITVLEVIRYVPLAGDLKPCSQLATHSPPQLYSTPAAFLWLDRLDKSAEPGTGTGTGIERLPRNVRLLLTCTRCAGAAAAAARSDGSREARARRGRARGREPEHRAPPLCVCARALLAPACLRAPHTGPRAAMCRAVPAAAEARRARARRHHSVSRSISICSRSTSFVFAWGRASNRDPAGCLVL